MNGFVLSELQVGSEKDGNLDCDLYKTKGTCDMCRDMGPAEIGSGRVRRERNEQRQGTKKDVIPL